ncbi:MAG: VPLPA-CTERM sorting domain-containing protein [Planctomycetota bacterium]
MIRFAIAGVVVAVAGQASAQAVDLTPAVIGTVDRGGDVDLSPADGFFSRRISISGTSRNDHRAIYEWDLSQLAGPTIVSANLSGLINQLQQAQNAPFTWELYVYSGDGSITFGDFNPLGEILVGTVTESAANTDAPFSVDVTAELQALVNAGATHIGVQTRQIGNFSIANADDYVLSVEAVPTPASAALLSLGGLAAARRRR